MSKKMIKKLFHVFSKITICVLFAAATYITAFWGWDAQISVQILWQILIVSAVCSIPILMYPKDEEKELSKKGMIVRQILYFMCVNISVLGFGRLFGWFYFTNIKMLVFMEALIVLVYGAVNLIIYMNDRMVAENLNQKLKEMREGNEKE